ncbi:hypothetical protein N9N67_05215 [Bacteriovoracaceae bacterium]|nr:hypothetical protein [Bacteriovoracaceae bacterium]
MVSVSKFTISFIVLMLGLMIPQASFAFLMVEPHFNRVSGQLPDSEEKNSFSGYKNGIRVGYVGENFMAGMNATLGNLTFSENFDELAIDRYRYGGLGTYLGFRTERLKIWVGYLNSSLEPTDAAEGRYYGQAVSYGIGANLFMHVYLNAEYFSDYFTQYENDNTGETNSVEETIKIDGQFLSLSFLFEF